MVTRVFDLTSYGNWYGTYKWMGYPVNESAGYQGFGLAPARVTYIDPASPIGVLPFIAINTAYTVGTKLYCKMASGGVYGFDVMMAGYLECITAGTSGSTTSSINVTRYVNFNGARFYSGTAVFVYRQFHSWDRACAGATGATAFQYNSTLNQQGYDTFTLPAWTTNIVYLVASNSVHDLLLTGKVGIGTYINALDTSYPNRLNHLEGMALSVSKAAWPATTYAAGATYNGYSLYTVSNPDIGHWSSGSVTGWLFRGTMAYRGFSAIHVPQGVQGLVNDDDYGYFGSYYGGAVTAYDCTMASTARDNPTYSQKCHPLIGGYRHLTRCTISSTANTGIAPPMAGGFVSNYGGGGIPGLPPGPSTEGTASSYDVCTFTRTLSSSTTPIFSQGIYYDSSSYNNPWNTEDNAYIFGGDCSGISGPLGAAWELEDPATMYDEGVGKINVFGIKANTASYPNAPRELQPRYWLVMDGTATASEVGVSGGRLLARVESYKRFQRSGTVYRTGGAHDGTGNYSLIAALTLANAEFEYNYAFENKKVDGAYTITHELQLQNTTGSGLAGLNVDDVVLTVIYPCDPNTEETEWATSSPDPCLGWVPHVASSNIPSSATAWTGTVTNGVRQKVSVTITPRRLGPVIVYIKIGLCPRSLSLWNPGTVPTLNVYFDPLPILTAA